LCPPAQLVIVPAHALFVFIIHGAIMSQLPKIKKPTVGFSARFFLEPSETRKMLPDNNLQTKKTTKT
jgi:hypothetical protein